MDPPPSAAIRLATVTTDDSQDLFSRGSILVGLIFVFYPGGKEKGLADFINTLRGEGVRNKTHLRALMTLFIDFRDAASVPSKCEVESDQFHIYVISRASLTVIFS